MYEVELKAHVADKEAVISRLYGFARYLGAVQKSDVYYAKDGCKRVRLRTETPYTPNVAPLLPDGGEAPQKPCALFTYKRKELRTDADGTTIEVNDEKECELSDAAPVEAFLRDSGFTVALEKHKNVLGFQCEQVHIELCEVPPLGDFLELETLSETDDAVQIETLRKSLLTMLAKAGISETQIETRYYSDMLRQAHKEAAELRQK